MSRVTPVLTISLITLFVVGLLETWIGASYVGASCNPINGTDVGEAGGRARGIKDILDTVEEVENTIEQGRQFIRDVSTSYVAWGSVALGIVFMGFSLFTCFFGCCLEAMLTPMAYLIVLVIVISTWIVQILVTVILLGTVEPLCVGTGLGSALIVFCIVLTVPAILVFLDVLYLIRTPAKKPAV